MPNHIRPYLTILALTFTLVLTVPAAAQTPVNYDNLSDEAISNWGQSEHVFQAKLTAVQAGPVARSFPPIYNYRLTLQVTATMRGSTPTGKPITLFYSARQKTPPTFPEGKVCLVAAASSRGQLRATRIEQVNIGNLNDARFATQLPLGWHMQDGKLLSPWATLGSKAWPSDQRGKGFMTCSQTGRPVLLAGGGLKLSVEPLPPAKKVKYANPDGDGEYRITVTNTGKKPLAIPALRQRGKDILWTESLVIMCRGKTYAAPGSTGISQPTNPTILAAGKSLSTVVQALRLVGPEWPRGGSRVEFLFCLGEQSSLKSFYYLSRHHDPIREALQAKQK